MAALDSTDTARLSLQRTAVCGRTSNFSRALSSHLSPARRARAPPPAHTDTMPMLLRRNLTCFYCGAKSELKKSPSIRQFDCKECEATNYLDEVSPAPFCLTRVASQGREGAAADQGIFLERRDNRSSCR